MRRLTMHLDFAFESGPGMLLGEYGRTKGMFWFFTFSTLVPFIFFLFLSVFAAFELLAFKEWDMNPLAWFIFTLSALSFLLWIIIRRWIGFATVSLYENGIRLQAWLRDVWIPWSEIDDLKHEHSIFYIKLLPLNYHVLKIIADGHRFDIETGSGFVFENGQSFFMEIIARAENAELKEVKEWATF